MQSPRRTSKILPPAAAILALCLSLGPMARPGLAIPAAPLMTVYRFNGPATVPYYRADDVKRRGSRATPAGTLAQGSSLVPCLVLHRGLPLTDAKGTPYVGFDLIVDSRKATADATERFRNVAKRQSAHRVPNHHCTSEPEYVVSVRQLYDMNKAPFFDPPHANHRRAATAGQTQVDAVVRAFHNSPQCAKVQQKLMGRRKALDAAWRNFAGASKSKWSQRLLDQARNLDYVLRTALFEGHLDRGCSAYGACERNVIALSIRNRALEKCSSAQGCRRRGDFQGVAAKVSQYNIWDEVLTQISGLTSCFLRDDLARQPSYEKLRAMYEQSQPDVERILFGPREALKEIFPGTSVSRSSQLRHYYHPPAMGKCFPNHPRVEYISGAVARRGGDFALIADTRVKIGTKRDRDYEFALVSIQETKTRDVLTPTDDYRGFLLDGRKVSLARPRRCAAWGTPAGCEFPEVGRHRKTPGWLSTGNPIQFRCQIESRGPSCQEPGRPEMARVGGVCDVDMQPIRGVP